MNLFKTLLLVLFIGIFSCTKTEMVEPVNDIFSSDPAVLENFNALLFKTTQIRDRVLAEYVEIDRKSVVSGNSSNTGYGNTCLMGFSDTSGVLYYINNNSRTKELLADAISFMLKIESTGQNELTASDNRTAIKDKLLEVLKDSAVDNQDYLTVSLDPKTGDYCAYVLDALNDDLARIVTEIVTVGNNPYEVFEEF